MGISAVKWKPYFPSKEKLCNVVNSTPWHISFASVDISAKNCFNVLFQKIKNKWRNENLQILDLHWWKAMCKSESTQKPLEDVMGNLSPFILNKMLVVVFMYNAFGQKLWH